MKKTKNKLYFSAILGIFFQLHFFATMGMAQPEPHDPNNPQSIDFYNQFNHANHQGQSFITHWRLVAQDDFNDDVPQDNSCYTQTAYCIKTAKDVRGNERSIIHPCDHHSTLAKLNKCLWMPYEMQNPWDPQSGDLSPDKIKIHDGVIEFQIEKHGPDHYTAAVITSVGYLNKTELTQSSSNHPTTISKESIVDQGAQDYPSGLRQRYGRFEVVAKISNPNLAAGSTGAAWLLGDYPLQVDPDITIPWPIEHRGWPGDGELDIMEFWTSKPHQVTQTYHYSDPAVTDASLPGGHLSNYVEVQINPLDEFHRYAVEWTPQYIRFFYDDQVTLVIDRQRVKNITNVPMAWILGFSAFRWDKNEDVAHQNFMIDSIKNYVPCTVNEISAHDSDCITPKQDSFPLPSVTINKVYHNLMLADKSKTMTLDLFTSAGSSCSKIKSATVMDMSGRVIGYPAMQPVEARLYPQESITIEFDMNEVFSSTSSGTGVYLLSLQLDCQEQPLVQKLVIQ